MRAKEEKKKIRKEKRAILNLRGRMIMLITLEIGASVLFALGLSEALNLILPEYVQIPLLIELTVFSLLVSFFATIIMTKIIFEPIKELRSAMEKVANGDFSVAISTKSTSKDIREIFHMFNLMTRELRATEVLQTDFVSNVSHEFKTPINAIEGYATLLQSDENFDNSSHEYVEKILFNTNRLSTLVGNILLLSKIENQTIGTGNNQFRLDEQIRQSIVGLESAWEKKEIEFDVEMDEVEFVGNENLFYHVWCNLIGNAIKFSPVGGVVSIKLEKLDGCVLFTVEDNGCGLSPEVKKHLFDKFYQGDSSHKQEGNGLGLALVKRILTTVGGEIWAENREGGGARFCVRLED